MTFLFSPFEIFFVIDANLSYLTWYMYKGHSFDKRWSLEIVCAAMCLCKAPFSKPDSSSILYLQVIQNAAAQVPAKSSKHNRINPVYALH